MKIFQEILINVRRAKVGELYATAPENVKIAVLTDNQTLFSFNTCQIFILNKNEAGRCLTAGRFCQKHTLALAIIYQLPLQHFRYL